MLYNSIGRVFSGPEIKHRLRSQVHQFPPTQLKNKATSLKLFKVKQRARPADSAAHPGRASRAVQAMKLASWWSCTIAATQPETKEEGKLSSPNCQAFYRINYVSHCASSFCCQPDRETLQFSNLQKQLMPALHYILCDD